VLVLLLFVVLDDSCSKWRLRKVRSMLEELMSRFDQRCVPLQRYDLSVVGGIGGIDRWLGLWLGPPCCVHSIW
jgi:hypothetical protein